MGAGFQSPKLTLAVSAPLSPLRQGLPTEVDVDLTFEEMFSGCVSHSHTKAQQHSLSIDCPSLEGNGERPRRVSQ